MSQPLEEQAEAIFADLLDVPAADRPARAAAACGDDAPLLARVRTLLAAMPAAEGFLSSPTMDAASADAPPTPSAVAAVGERPGDHIGPYKLLEQIGEGGFGVVFKAEQERPVRRLVALKVIKPGMDTGEVITRFEAERQALALMDHQNIAKVFDAGSTAAGRPYFVMELVRGSPVTDYADQRQLPTADRVALAVQVCRAVQHAHSKGIIHRDLKPSNVLVTTADDKPVPKVIDFGIAKATQGRLTDRTLFTAHRQLIGTPQYMSPEQADTDGIDVDTRTDVYSLGVLLYELLVGTTPLDARSLRSAAFEAMRRMIRDVDPAKPSTKLSTLGDAGTAVAAARRTDAKALGRQLHGELDWIVMRALEKDRSRRYDTAAAMADDLGRYLAGEAVLAGPVSGTYRLRVAVRRHRAAVAVGATVAACLLLGVAGTTWGLVQARHQRAAAVASAGRAAASERVAQQRAAEAEATLSFFTNLLTQASPEQSRDATVSRVIVNAVLLPATRQVGDDHFAGTPWVRATVRDVLAETLIELGRPDLAEPQAKAAWDARRAGQGEDARQTLASMINYGIALDRPGHYAEAAGVLRDALDRSQRAMGDDDRFMVRPVGALASALDQLGRPAEALDLYKQAWDRDRRAYGDDGRNTLQSMGSYAYTLTVLGRRAEAAEMFKQQWDRTQRSLGDGDPETLRAMFNYASAIGNLGRGAESLDLTGQVLARFRRVMGDDHPQTLAVLRSYAISLLGAGRNAEAADAFHEAWDRGRRTEGDDAPSTQQAVYGYATAVARLGRHGEAADAFRRALDQDRRLVGDDAPDTLEAAVDYAAEADAAGRGAEAVPVLRHLADGLARRHPNDGHLGAVRAALDRCLAVQGAATASTRPATAPAGRP